MKTTKILEELLQIEAIKKCDSFEIEFFATDEEVGGIEIDSNYDDNSVGLYSEFKAVICGVNYKFSYNQQAFNTDYARRAEEAEVGVYDGDDGFGVWREDCQVLNFYDREVYEEAKNDEQKIANDVYNALDEFTYYLTLKIRENYIERAYKISQLEEKQDDLEELEEEIEEYEQAIEKLEQEYS